jgi:hypothetical protein
MENDDQLDQRSLDSMSGLDLDRLDQGVKF